MICPKCGQETQGKYCVFCGALLEDDIEIKEVQYDTEAAKLFAEPETQDVKNPDDIKKKSGKNTGKKQQGSSGQPVQKKVIKKVKKKSGKGRRRKTKVKKVGQRKIDFSAPIEGISRTVSLVLRICSGGLMIFMNLKLFLSFWEHRNDLGIMMKVIHEKNLQEAAYLISALLILGFGMISTLWILSGKKMADNGRLKKYDTGRGIISFLIFGGLGIFAGTAALLIPADPETLRGVQKILEITASHKNLLVSASGVGLILCIVRKLKKY